MTSMNVSRRPLSLVSLSTCRSISPLPSIHCTIQMSGSSVEKSIPLTLAFSMLMMLGGSVCSHQRMLFLTVPVFLDQDGRRRPVAFLVVEDPKILEPDVRMLVGRLRRLGALFGIDRTVAAATLRTVLLAVLRKGFLAV